MAIGWRGTIGGLVVAAAAMFAQEPTGYADSQYGRFSVVRTANGAAARLDVVLTPTCTLKGLVLGEDGNPLAGATVQAVRKFGTSVPAKSFESGGYELQHLEPGEYQLHVRLPERLRRTTLVRDGRSGEIWGYPPTHTETDWVPLAGGASLEGQNIELRRVRLVSIKVHLTDVDSRGPLAGATVDLMAGLDREKRRSDALGAAEFDLMPAGEYTLAVTREGALPVTMPVAAYGDTVVPVMVPLVVRLEGAVRGLTAGQSVVVTIQPEEAWTPSLSKPLAGNEPFSVVLPTGRYRINARVVAPQRGNFVARIRLGEQDAGGGVVTIAESGNPKLEIEISDPAGRVAGHGTDLQRCGKP